MKTIASVACILLLGVSGCATGSVEGDGLFEDAGPSGTDSGANPVVIVGSSSSGPSVTIPTGGSSPTSTGGDDAGSPSSDNTATGEDAGFGGFGGGGEDAGEDFGVDAGGFGGFGGGEDAGGDFGFDAGGYGGGGYGGSGEGSGCVPPSDYGDCDCDPSEHECAANGCYGGYYCDESGYSLKCVTAEDCGS